MKVGSSWGSRPKVGNKNHSNMGQDTAYMLMSYTGPTAVAAFIMESILPWQPLQQQDAILFNFLSNESNTSESSNFHTKE